MEAAYYVSINQSLKQFSLYIFCLFSYKKMNILTIKFNMFTFGMNENDLNNIDA